MEANDVNDILTRFLTFSFQSFNRASNYWTQRSIRLSLFVLTFSSTKSWKFSWWKSTWVLTLPQQVKNMKSTQKFESKWFTTHSDLLVLQITLTLWAGKKKRKEKYLTLKIFPFSYDPKSAEMLSHAQNIAVNHDICTENYCHENCHLVSCELCLNCMSETNLQNAHEAHLEHKRRGGFKRSFPKSTHSFNDLTLNNKVSQRWFAAKCLLDPDWCWRKIRFSSVVNAWTLASNLSSSTSISINFNNKVFFTELPYKKRAEKINSKKV